MGRGGVATILLGVIAILLSGCLRPPPLQPPAGVHLTPLRSISPLEARVLLALTGVKGIPVRHAVDCYRMEYPGIGADGRPSQLSGLLALPRGVAAKRLVSFQHGTATTRSAVPSKPDGTGLAAAILFAGNGYALIAPDYPGMGSDPGRHPYYVADAIGPAVVGMVEAAQKLDRVPNAPVFLSGFSQGGWASLVALRMLEDAGATVLGAAPVAAPIDLRHTSLPAALQGRAPSHSLYLAYAAWGQSAHYGEPLDSVLTPEYSALVERLFDGATPEDIVAALPTEPRRMFNARLLDAYDHGGSHWYLNAFAAASLTDMQPRAPVRLYFGAMDIDVVPQEALTAERTWRAQGAEVTAVNVGPFGHDESMLAAAPLVFAWLSELEAAGR